MADLFKPQITREGSASTRLIAAIQALGYNPGGNIVRATVTSEPPNLSISVDTDITEKLSDIPSEGLVCNPDLLAHTMSVKIDGITRTIEFPNRLTKGTKIYAFEPEHGQLLYILTLAE